jgi:SAM-dependent methyltransferase
LKESIEKTYREGVENSINRYKGIPMLCAYGLHEKVEEKVRDYLLPRQAVLDLGCGRGALSLRLREANLCVDAVDMFDLCMCKEEVHFTCMAIEDYLMHTDQVFDAIFLIEVLEHLENPYGILRLCHRRLKNGGLLFLSTPNVDSDFSRTWFFLKGRYPFFEKADLEHSGHINPILRFQLDYIIEDLNMNIEEEFWIGGEKPGAALSWRLKSLLHLLRLYRRIKGYERKDGLVRGLIVRK